MKPHVWSESDKMVPNPWKKALYNVPDGKLTFTKVKEYFFFPRWEATWLSSSLPHDVACLVFHVLSPLRKKLKSWYLPSALQVNETIIRNNKHVHLSSTVLCSFHMPSSPDSMACLHGRERKELRPVRGHMLVRSDSRCWSVDVEFPWLVTWVTLNHNWINRISYRYIYVHICKNIIITEGAK